MAETPDYLMGVPGRFRAAECLRCGLWYQSPRVVPDDVGALYPEGYGPHEGGEVTTTTSRERRRGLKAWAKRAALVIVSNWRAGVGLVPKYVEDGRLLEIGCGSGGFLAQLRELGWRRLEAIEPVQAAADRARALGLRVTAGRAEVVMPRLDTGAYDVVVASMVLEHLPNPFEVVDQVARVLKPGGQFVFSTVVRDSLEARLYGAYWAGFDLPRHMVWLSRSDVRQLLRGSFADARWYYHDAPQDFVRSASWRKRGLADRFALTMGERRLRGLVFPLALLGLTSRVSVRCRRVGGSRTR